MNFSLKSWKERFLYTPQPDDDRSRLRTVLDSLILHLHPTRVPASAIRFTYTWGLGGVAAVLSVLLGLTGVMLMFRYEPTVDRAYASILALEAEVVFGSLIRSIHHWSASALVVVACLHLVRVFLTGGFKKGRFVNWLIGIGLLLLTLFFNFTGYLLPWDQLAYWAMTISTTMIGYIPLIGEAIKYLVLAGPEVGQGTLSNFYALHVAMLPAVGAVALGYHFWRVRKDGGISQPVRKEGQRIERVTTIPHLLRKEIAVAVVVITAIAIWGMLIPAPLEELANPDYPPSPAKAAWYFVGLQELLLHMDPLAFIILSCIVLAGMVFLPRWDKQDENIGVYFRSSVGRRAAFMGGVVSTYIVPLLVVTDEFWINLPAMLPQWPVIISNGLIPLLFILAGLAAIYCFARWALKANHSEALVGVFACVMVGLVMLTIIGYFFRGPSMTLVLPFQ
ncbi:MAG: cytochrome bc complex cytochrome b subunit [Chloroflexi bacterium]|nr:cytochrome bc complex cytochrome b subunit [Chloroflexota bacterium]